MKKTFAVLTALILLLTALGLCASFAEDANLNPPGEFPICKEKVKLTIGVAGNPNIIDFYTNRQTQMLEEEGNFELEFNTFTVNEMVEKLNVMIQAGGDDLPDIILIGQKTRVKDTAVYNWAQTGAIIPITDYVKNSAYFFTESMISSGTDLIPQLTMPDGEIYYLPAYARSIGNEYQCKNWIYQPWLDKLGLNAPTDAESLYNVLKAFKTQDPNGNGTEDEIPFIAHGGSYANHWRRSLMSMFCDVGNSSDWVAVKDGKLYASYATEEYREGLRYIKKLFDEGLISPLSFTQDEAQFKALIAKEPTLVGMTASPSIAASLPATDGRRAEYEGIAPLASADGTVLTPYNPTTASAAFLITKNCKNPEAAFRLGDLLCSEKYTLMTRWGEFGVDWITPAADAEAMYAALGYAPFLQETGNISWGSPQNQCWVCEGPYVRGYKIPAGMVWNGNPLDSEHMIAKIMPDYVGKGPVEYISKLIYTEDENDLIAEPLSTINSYVKECFALFVTGKMDIETDWDSYLKELDNIGIDDIITVMQAAYDRSIQQ